MSQQRSTIPSSTGCVALTRRTMDNRPVRRRRPGAVRHLLLAAAFLACSSQLLVVDANSWWWVPEWSLGLKGLFCLIPALKRAYRSSLSFISLPECTDNMTNGGKNLNYSLCVACCVCFGGDVPVVWWSTNSEWNKCEGSVTIFTLAEPQMALHGACCCCCL